MWSIVTTSLVATAATTPFAVYHFQTFSFYGFVANTIAIPMTSFWVMPCILLAYILAPFGLDGWLIDVAGYGISLTIKIAEMVAAWPYSIIYLPAMPWVALAAMTLGGLWLCIWKLRWRWWGLVPIVIGCFYPFYTQKPDVMISPDAKVWAVRMQDGWLAVSNLNRDEFVYTQWQLRLGNPELVDSTALPDSETQLRCDEQGCVYKLNNKNIAFPTMESANLEDCEEASVLVATVMVRDCKAEHVLDEPEFWHHGSHTIYAQRNGLGIEESRSRRAIRPWSPGWSMKHSNPSSTLGDDGDGW